MNKTTPPNDELTRLTETLTADSLTALDFDRLREVLDRRRELMTDLEHATEQLRLLRRDYIERISGMAKAIAAVSRRADGLESALTYLRSLDTLAAEDLIEQYRLISARFRDAFPTTFAGTRK